MLCRSPLSLLPKCLYGILVTTYSKAKIVGVSWQYKFRIELERARSCNWFSLFWDCFSKVCPREFQRVLYQHLNTQFSFLLINAWTSCKEKPFSLCCSVSHRLEELDLVAVMSPRLPGKRGHTRFLLTPSSHNVISDLQRSRKWTNFPDARTADCSICFVSLTIFFMLNNPQAFNSFNQGGRP